MPKQKVSAPSRKRFFIPVGVIVVLVLLGSLWATHTWPFQRTAGTNPDATRDVTSNPSPKNNNPPGKSDSTASPTGNATSNEVPVSPTMTATITLLEEKNNEINFAARVQGTTTTGTCVVTFSNPNDRPVTKQFTAGSTGGVSTCGPVAIPATEFSYLGKWAVAFHYYVGDQQATANSEINVQ